MSPVVYSVLPLRALQRKLSKNVQKINFLVVKASIERARRLPFEAPPGAFSPYIITLRDPALLLLLLCRYFKSEGNGKNFGKIGITINADTSDVINLPFHLLPVSTILLLRKLFGDLEKIFLLR